MEKTPVFNKYNLKIQEFSGWDRSISGIFVTPRETVATDSITLIRVSAIKIDKENLGNLKDGTSIPLKNFQPFILSKAGAEKILKIIPKKTNYSPHIDKVAVYESKKGVVEMGVGDFDSLTLHKLMKIEGMYPKYQEIFTGTGKYKTVCVNAHFLKKLVNFLSGFIADIDKKNLLLKIPLNPEQPIIFVAENKDQTAEAWLMPLKPD